ncbi:MAG: type II 3-dehydroquinate dehydratase [Actinobacteria bacterium]|nr:type II 3-dehydroquinate dehydratase [Actinomycetota bacterium]
MPPRILVLNGPNLNLLGTREPEIYGHGTLGELVDGLRAAYIGRAEISDHQTNIEGELVSALHNAESDGIDGVAFNAGAYTHTSIALRDAIAGISVPVVEIHISNVHRREAFRHTSMLAEVCLGQILGFGRVSYSLGVEAIVRHLNQ